MASVAKLGVSSYRKQNHPDRNGIACHFMITDKPKKSFSVVQNIDVLIRVVDEHGEVHKYQKKYSELWQYGKKNRHAKQDDAFLVPVAWREGYNGFYQVSAVAYLMKNKPTKFIKPRPLRKAKRGEPPTGRTHVEPDGSSRPGLPPWGTLHGRWETFVPGGKALAGLTRVIKMEWKNLDNPGQDLSSGADIKVSVDTSHVH